MNCVPIDMLPTQCPLLPTPWAGEAAEVYFTSEHSLMDLRCATSLRTDECDIIYGCNIYNLNSRLAHFNALWMEYVRFELESWRISCDVHFAGHLRSNRTNVWSDKSNIWNVQSGGARGLELRTAALNTELVFLEALKKWFCAFKL